MMKRMLTLVMVMVMAIGALADTWTDPETGITWTYEIKNGNAAVGSWSVYVFTRAIATSTTGAISIPNTLGGCPVTSICDWAFQHCRGLTSVTIPSSVTSIGDYAFDGCSGLTSVTIPSSVTSIGNGAFSGCSGLGEGVVIVDGCVLTVNGNCPSVVDIPQGTRLIAGGAFYGCSGLTSVTIPSSVTSIGVVAFDGCSGLTSVTIPSSVTSIGSYTFEHCSGLTSVTIPSNVTSIGYGAFMYCSGLTSVTIQSGVTSIGAEAFLDCSGLTSVTMSEGLMNIGNSAFSGCCGLTSVTMSEGLTNIGNSAFSGCSGLTSVTIPSSVTSIGSEVFANCSSLVSITFDGEYPSTGTGIFSGTPADLVVHVKWRERKFWNDREIVYENEGGSKDVNVKLTVTNVVIHYIQTSEQSTMAAPVTTDTGIVNVMTEIKGGKVAIPESWAANYPKFASTFDADFTKALTMSSHKRDASGAEMLVWQDYVAGTDPTNPDDVFRASVTIVAGKPVVSFSPELSAEEAAKRIYRTFGKKSLYGNEEWVEVPAGQEADYNFFKVTVEML